MDLCIKRVQLLIESNVSVDCESKFLSVGDEFNEIILDVPKEYINTASPHVKIAGDHISYAYWFYQ